jgi:hypothetical protein
MQRLKSKPVIYLLNANEISLCTYSIAHKSKKLTKFLTEGISNQSASGNNPFCQTQMLLQCQKFIQSRYQTRGPSPNIRHPVDILVTPIQSDC